MSLGVVCFASLYVFLCAYAAGAWHLCICVYVFAHFFAFLLQSFCFFLSLHFSFSLNFEESVGPQIVPRVCECVCVCAHNMTNLEFAMATTPAQYNSKSKHSKQFSWHTKPCTTSDGRKIEAAEARKQAVTANGDDDDDFTTYTLCIVVSWTITYMLTNRAKTFTISDLLSSPVYH